MKTYNPQEIEPKWQKYWEENSIFAASDFDTKPKKYILDMFPYPSAAGLHVGHPEGYTATDIYSRYLRMKGYNVLHPMGWDAFGLPAENYAIKTGTNPRTKTQENINTFRKQIKSLGLSYDWNREIDTTDPEYYKWTQWIFLQLFKNGLAYEDTAPINFCPSCKTGLANEEVTNGLCERCGFKVERKTIRQWILKITKYADRLLADLEKLDWPESIKLMQKNWIGRSEGTDITFKLNVDFDLKVYTTRADTLYGCTYVVVAPEHEIIEIFKEKIDNYSEIIEYISSTKSKTELERTDLTKEKTGIKINGITAINPINDKQVPIFVADYVLGHYGTGAVMAVPAHDERDFDFAVNHNLPIEYVVEPKYVAISGDSAIEKDRDFVKRNAICAIVRNPKNNKYLCISWKNHRMNGLITGGIDKNEDVVEAARREVLEETGYNNLKHIGTEPLSINTFFYHRVKKENRWAHFTFIKFDLVNEEKEKTDNKEDSLHQVLWKTKDELEGFFTVFEGEYALNIIKGKTGANTDYGILINSGEFSGCESLEAMKKITQKLMDIGRGNYSINYKLRDWIFSRQRYWGEPIPIVHCIKCGSVPVPEEQLPVKLPDIKNYEPSGTGDSPLVNIKDWVNTTCPNCKGPGKRETNTMPQWAGSCWYYLRFIDPKNDKALLSKDKDKYWMAVDLYVGGAEHAVLHLLYARFWHKFLFDIGAVSTDEPFLKLKNQGMILAKDGRKMSKSLGNVVNPDDIISCYGADTLRLYEMFMGPFEQLKKWDTKSIEGVSRFLKKVWSLLEQKQLTTNKNSIILNTSIPKITDDIENFRFNTAISQLMILAGYMKDNGFSKKELESLIVLLSPFAPHITEEMWQILGHSESISSEPWPEASVIDSTNEFTIAVQVDGKFRESVSVNSEMQKDELIEIILKIDKMSKWITRDKIDKVFYVKNKIINLTTKKAKE